MCNRYTIAAPERLKVAQLAGEIIAKAFTGLAARYNISPSEMLPILARDDGDAWHATTMKWGFIPYFDKSAKPQKAPLNAKSETVLSLGIFRQAAQRRRCLLPADGFFEWHHLSETFKVPHYFYFRDHRPFYFAGIYETATEIHPPTCALLTTAPLPTVEPFHSRSPLILDDEQARIWSRAGSMTEETLSAIIDATRWRDELTQHIVTKAVGPTGANRIDGPECIAPFIPEPDLFG